MRLAGQIGSRRGELSLRIFPVFSPSLLFHYGLGAAVALLCATAVARPKVVAYVPNWIDLPAFAASIDYTKVTHLNIAFENPTDARGDLSFKPGNAALVAKAHRHGVKVLVSIGGGAAANDAALKLRYFALIKPANRSRFVAKLADYVSRHGFDGLDLDLEGPAINGDYGGFVGELAVALHRRGKLLTAALSRGYGGAKVPVSALRHFDFVNIMAYDETGPFAPTRPGQHASLQFARDNVAYWIGRGLPKAKAVLGVPFYGYGFGAAFQKRGYPYAQIVERHRNAENADQAGNTIWYNGIPTIQAKARFVSDQGLGGIMIWSLDQDASGERSLLSAIHAQLNRPLVRRASPQRPATRHGP